MRKKALSFAFRHTYPMLISWIPIAIAFGLMMKQAGYSFLWTGFFCVVAPCGSLQMVASTFLHGTISWLALILTVFAISFRHIFYGLSFLERFRRFGKGERFYLIFMLCDELYSLFCSYEIPAELDERRVHLYTAILLQLYWIGLSMLAGLLGAVIPFDLNGVDFALTALFTVILIDMLRSGTTKLPAAAAAVSSVLCLLIFGADSFLIPALLTTCAVLLLLRKRMEKGGNA